jgi:RNA polymerase sigma factor (sigma-70 family)
MDLYLEHERLIKEITAHFCRRYHFSREEAEDFGSHVKIKLIDDDCSILRQHQGKSSMKTYLTVVIGRQLLDYQNSHWGKFRPSAGAVRLGPLAVDLERLIERDRHTFGEACEKLKDCATVAELADIKAKLKPRIKWHEVGEEILDSEPSRELNPEKQFEEKERQEKGARVYRALQRAVQTLSKEDRLFLKMWWDEFSLADIARAWNVPQKPLYPRKDRIFKKLRDELRRQGVRRQDIEDILGGRLASDFPDF